MRFLHTLRSIVENTPRAHPNAKREPGKAKALGNGGNTPISLLAPVALYGDPDNVV
jgi:hypothetical protein